MENCPFVPPAPPPQRRRRRGLRRWAAGSCPPPPLPPVLTGHASSLLPYQPDTSRPFSQQVAAALAAHECGAVAQGAREEAVAARADGGKERWALAVRPWCPHRPPAPALVLSGHAASLTPN
mgnify:CR=1 FL=1